MELTRVDIERIINKAMVDEFELEPESLSPGAHIKNDLGLDSLDIIDMVIVLEAAFGFSIRDKAPLLKIQTLGDVASFIEETAAMMSEKTESAV